MSKKEARTLKQAEKKAKARAFAEHHTTPKRAKQSQDFASRKDLYPVWQFQRLDWEGPWGWHKISLEQWFGILKKLSDFERQTWGEIESGDDQRRSHLIQVGECPNPEVSKRLQELKLEEFDELFSLRLSGTERIYGMLEGRVLKILWYDPTHSVWPSEKKHT